MRMRIRMRSIAKATIALFLCLACTSADTEITDQQTFNSYWNQGKAEITTYSLSQARYGELREGTAVTIFVTEPWNNRDQVKSDGQGDFQVMKLNLTKNFNTGIYPYSLMTSAFSKADNGQAHKVSTSSQEWCGHSFTQLNRGEDGWNFQQRSYFESEGDESTQIETCLLEDEIWNMIRLMPDSLPQGNIKILPSTMYLRFSHIDVDPQSAYANLSKAGKEWIYYVQYPDLRRTITIKFNSNYPHCISGWQETYLDGFGPNARELTTSASVLQREMLDYWNLNGNADEKWREELGLD